MAKSVKKNVEVAGSDVSSGPPINIGESVSSKRTFVEFELWVIGDTPLICHSWAYKNRIAMLQKQQKTAKQGKEIRDPEDDYQNSLYNFGEEIYGFPATGFKKAVLSSAHKDKGIPRSSARSSLWIDADMVRVQPALAGAICDVSLLRIYGSKPEMREDMVRVGVGLNKTASLAYRGQFTTWALRVTGKFNPTVITADAFHFLINESGMGVGIGEWRIEKDGMFGAYHVGNAEEGAQWSAFAAGKGPLPVPRKQVPSHYKIAAE